MNPSLLLYIFTILVLAHAISFIIHDKKKESFVPAFSFIVDEKNDKLRISVPEVLDNKDIRAVGQIKNVEVVYHNGNNLPTQYSLRVTDAFSFALHSKQTLAENREDFLTVLNTERGAMMIRPLDMPTKTIFQDGVRIGYLDEIDKQLIQMLYKCLKDRVITPKYTLVKIDPMRKVDTATFFDNRLDALMLFSSYDSSLVKTQIKEGFRFDVVDYAEMLDAAKLSVHSPFAKVKILDFSTVFALLQGVYSPKAIIAFDIIIVGPHLVDPKPFNVELDKIVRHTNKPEVINFYGLYYNVFPQSEAFAKELDVFTQVRQTLQVLEQYANEPGFEYTFKNNVHGFMDSMNKAFIIAGNTVEGIALPINATVVLSNQDRKEENGRYNVISASEKQVIMQLVSSTSLSTPSYTSTQFEPGYRCYDHPEIQSKGLCDSLYNHRGEPKVKKTYWDKACEKNTDCPFYQKNKNYANYRGGCIDGMCEMPIGVKQVSYRKYDPDSKPLCHGCINPLNAACCEDQKNKAKYPHLKSPDYAFELDFFERQRSDAL